MRSKQYNSRPCKSIDLFSILGARLKQTKSLQSDGCLKRARLKKLGRKEENKNKVIIQIVYIQNAIIFCFSLVVLSEVITSWLDELISVLYSG